MDTIIYDGLRFTRYPHAKLRAHRVYYRNYARGYLHRYVWEKHNGLIPRGYHVHHKDGDSSNNAIDNLECLSSSDHAKRHYPALAQRRKKWLATEPAKRWYIQNGKRSWQQREPATKICVACGERFETFFGNRTVVCSPACKTKQRKQSGKDDISRSCCVCDSSFTCNKYCSKQTCSAACKSKLVWKKRKSA